MTNHDRRKLKLKGSFPENLKQFATLRNVDKDCIFLGHIDNPEELYPNIDILLKPTRDNNPWGRDLLEAMSCEVPVISVGSYSKFVNKNTGYLMKKFDTKVCAHQINKISKNKVLKIKLGRQARHIIKKLCSKSACQTSLEKFWS